MRRIDLGPDDPNAAVLLDHVNAYLQMIYGPDESALEIRLCNQPFSLTVLTEQGNRLTLDRLDNPSVN